MDPNSYDDDGRTPLMKAAIEGDLEEVERLLGLGADPEMKDLKWGTTTAEDYAARLSSQSEAHRKVRERLAEACEGSGSIKETRARAGDEILMGGTPDEQRTSWPYETVRAPTGNYVTRIKSSLFCWAAVGAFATGIYLVSQEVMFGGFLILTISPCLLLYPLVRMMFGGKDSIGSAVVTVVAEEYLKSKAKDAVEKSSRRRR